MKVLLIFFGCCDLLFGNDQLSEEQKFQRRVEEMTTAREARIVADYSSLTFEELVKRAVSTLREPLYFDEVMLELSKHSEVLKPLLLEEARKEFVGNEGYQVRLFMALPYISAAGGKRFQVEICKVILFNRSASVFDDIYINHGELLKIISESDKDESQVIRRLIRERGILPGSALEKNWAKIFKVKSSSLSVGDEKGEHRSPSEFESSASRSLHDSPENSSWPILFWSNALQCISDLLDKIPD